MEYHPTLVESHSTVKHIVTGARRTAKALGSYAADLLTGTSAGKDNEKRRRSRRALALRQLSSGFLADYCLNHQIIQAYEQKYSVVSCRTGTYIWLVAGLSTPAAPAGGSSSVDSLAKSLGISFISYITLPGISLGSGAIFQSKVALARIAEIAVQLGDALSTQAGSGTRDDNHVIRSVFEALLGAPGAAADGDSQANIEADPSDRLVVAAHFARSIAPFMRSYPVGQSSQSSNATEAPAPGTPVEMSTPGSSTTGTSKPSTEAAAGPALEGAPEGTWEIGRRALNLLRNLHSHGDLIAAPLLEGGTAGSGRQSRHAWPKPSALETPSPSPSAASGVTTESDGGASSSPSPPTSADQATPNLDIEPSASGALAAAELTPHDVPIFSPSTGALVHVLRFSQPVAQVATAGDSLAVTFRRGTTVVLDALTMDVRFAVRGARAPTTRSRPLLPVSVSAETMHGPAGPHSSHRDGTGTAADVLDDSDAEEPARAPSLGRMLPPPPVALSPLYLAVGSKDRAGKPGAEERAIVCASVLALRATIESKLAGVGGSLGSVRALPGDSSGDGSGDKGGFGELAGALLAGASARVASAIGWSADAAGELVWQEVSRFFHGDVQGGAGDREGSTSRRHSSASTVGAGAAADPAGMVVGAGQDAPGVGYGEGGAAGWDSAAPGKGQRAANRNRSRIGSETSQHSRGAGDLEHGADESSESEHRHASSAQPRPGHIAQQDALSGASQSDEAHELIMEAFLQRLADGSSTATVHDIVDSVIGSESRSAPGLVPAVSRSGWLAGGAAAVASRAVSAVSTAGQWIGGTLVWAGIPEDSSLVAGSSAAGSRSTGLVAGWDHLKKQLSSTKGRRAVVQGAVTTAHEAARAARVVAGAAKQVGKAAAAGMKSAAKASIPLLKAALRMAADISGEAVEMPGDEPAGSTNAPRPADPANPFSTPQVESLPEESNENADSREARDEPGAGCVAVYDVHTGQLVAHFRAERPGTAIAALALEDPSHGPIDCSSDGAAPGMGAAASAGTLLATASDRGYVAHVYRFMPPQRRLTGPTTDESRTDTRGSASRAVLLAVLERVAYDGGIDDRVLPPVSTAGLAASLGRTRARLPGTWALGVPRRHADLVARLQRGVTHARVSSIRFERGELGVDRSSAAAGAVGEATVPGEGSAAAGCLEPHLVMLCTDHGTTHVFDLPPLATLLGHWDQDGGRLPLPAAGTAEAKGSTLSYEPIDCATGRSDGRFSSTAPVPSDEVQLGGVPDVSVERHRDSFLQRRRADALRQVESVAPDLVPVAQLRTPAEPAYSPADHAAALQSAVEQKLPGATALTSVPAAPLAPAGCLPPSWSSCAVLPCSAPGAEWAVADPKTKKRWTASASGKCLLLACTRDGRLHCHRVSMARAFEPESTAGVSRGSGGSSSTRDASTVVLPKLRMAASSPISLDCRMGLGWPFGVHRSVQTPVSSSEAKDSYRPVEAACGEMYRGPWMAKVILGTGAPVTDLSWPPEGALALVPRRGGAGDPAAIEDPIDAFMALDDAEAFLQDPSVQSTHVLKSCTLSQAVSLRMGGIDASDLHDAKAPPLPVVAARAAREESGRYGLAPRDRSTKETQAAAGAKGASATAAGSMSMYPAQDSRTQSGSPDVTVRLGAALGVRAPLVHMESVPVGAGSAGEEFGRARERSRESTGGLADAIRVEGSSWGVDSPVALERDAGYGDVAACIGGGSHASGSLAEEERGGATPTSADMRAMARDDAISPPLAQGDGGGSFELQGGGIMQDHFASGSPVPGGTALTGTGTGGSTGSAYHGKSDAGASCSADEEDGGESEDDQDDVVLGGGGAVSE